MINVLHVGKFYHPYAGGSWDQAGAEGVPGDRAGTPADSRQVFLLAPDRYGFDVTDMVRAWLADPGSNYGAMLRSAPAVADLLQYNDNFKLASSEYNYVSDRPRLSIVYAAGGPQSTFDAAAATGKHVIFFVRHKSGPLYLWYEIISPRYLRQHTDALKVKGVDYEDVVKEITEMIKSVGIAHKIRRRIYCSIFPSKTISVQGCRKGAGKGPSIPAPLWPPSPAPCNPFIS